MKFQGLFLGFGFHDCIRMSVFCDVDTKHLQNACLLFNLSVAIRVGCTTSLLLFVTFNI